MQPENMTLDDLSLIYTNLDQANAQLANMLNNLNQLMAVELPTEVSANVAKIQICGKSLAKDYDKININLRKLQHILQDVGTLPEVNAASETISTTLFQAQDKLAYMLLALPYAQAEAELAQTQLVDNQSMLVNLRAIFKQLNKQIKLLEATHETYRQI